MGSTISRFKEQSGNLCKTLLLEIMAIVAVFKKPDGSCGFMNMQIEQQKFLFCTRKFSRKLFPPTDYANSGMDPIDCKKANKISNLFYDYWEFFKFRGNFFKKISKNDEIQIKPFSSVLFTFNKSSKNKY